MCCQTQQCVECGVQTEEQALEVNESVKFCRNLQCKYRVPNEISIKVCTTLHRVYNCIVHMYRYTYAY